MPYRAGMAAPICFGCCRSHSDRGLTSQWKGFNTHQSSSFFLSGWSPRIMGALERLSHAGVKIGMIPSAGTARQSGTCEDSNRARCRDRVGETHRWPKPLPHVNCPSVPRFQACPWKQYHHSPTAMSPNRIVSWQLMRQDTVSATATLTLLSSADLFIIVAGRPSTTSRRYACSTHGVTHNKVQVCIRRYTCASRGVYEHDGLA